MLTRMHVRNFKRFGSVTIELGNPVVFIGPNNSGKTTALQALALWSVGLRKWVERREGGSASKRPGVTINRRELTNIPLLKTYALWRAMHVRKGNTPIRVEIIVEGVHNDQPWVCGLEFDSVDQENIRCRPIGQREGNGSSRIGDGPRNVKIAFLPPISGLISQEDLLQTGSIERRIGEGRTAEVLRNLCYQVLEHNPNDWQQLTAQLDRLFGVQLEKPVYDTDTGTLSLEYSERDGVRLDLNASGQGFRQILLLLAYLYANPGAVLLLDEPDAHLEILRQRQVYQTFVDISVQKQNQIVIATHSEIILEEAAQRDLVIAFVGQPHRINKTPQVQKALATYGFDDYYQAEQTGWVLYLEGATDLAILKALARITGHAEAEEALQRVFVVYVYNQPRLVQEHFYAVREAFPDLVGAAIFDRLSQSLPEREGVQQTMWQRNEIENYLTFPEVLVAFARAGLDADLWGSAESTRRADLMTELISLYVPPIALQDRNATWWRNTKMSTDFLDVLFAEFYKRLGLRNNTEKSDYYQLADYIPVDLIAPEVTEKLNLIASVAREGSTRAKKRLDALEQQMSADIDPVNDDTDSDQTIDPDIEDNR